MSGGESCAVGLASCVHLEVWRSALLHVVLPLWRDRHRQLPSACGTPKIHT